MLFLKTIIPRQRPLFNLKDSFPSGHSTSAFTPLPFLERKVFKNINTIWIVIACLFVFTRVWFGLHYLSDITIGSFIGYSIAFIIKNIEERNYKKHKKLK